MRTCRHLRGFKAALGTEISGAAVCDTCVQTILKGLLHLKSQIVGNRMEFANGTETNFPSQDQELKKLDAAAAAELREDLTL